MDTVKSRGKAAIAWLTEWYTNSRLVRFLRPMCSIIYVVFGVALILTIASLLH